MSGRRKIDDRKPPVPQDSLPVLKHTGAIRSTVDLRIRHHSDRRHILRR